MKHQAKYTEKNKNTLIEAMYLSGYFCEEIAKEIGVSRKTISRYLDKKQMLRSWKSTRELLGLKKLSKKWINKSGYVVVYRPKHRQSNNNRLVLEHRMVMSDVLNRQIRPEENVHHINGDKTDNNPANLQLIDRALHTKLHNKNRDYLIKKGKKCLYYQCDNKTIGKLGLCTRCYRRQYYRLKMGRINNIYEYKTLNSIVKKEIKSETKTCRFCNKKYYCTKRNYYKSKWCSKACALKNLRRKY